MSFESAKTIMLTVHNKDDIKKSEISSKWEYRDMNNVTDGLTLLSTYKLTSLLLT